MMNFRTIKTNIITLLAAAAAGRYDTLQAPRQKQGSEDINRLKKVIVYLSTDDFLSNKGTTNGELQSSPTYKILLQVSANSTYADGADPSSLVDAEILADNQIDELIEIVFQIIMDARNMDLGMAIGQVNNRYIKNVTKGDPARDGDTVTVVASMDLSLNTPEDVLGETGTVGTTVKSSLDISGDDVQKTAIDVEP